MRPSCLSVFRTMATRCGSATCGSGSWARHAESIHPRRFRRSWTPQGAPMSGPVNPQVSSEHVRRLLSDRVLQCLLACLLFLFNFVAWTTSNFDRVQQPRRYGEDMSVATTAYLERRQPTGAPSIKLSSPAALRYAVDLQAFMLETELRHGLRPWQFWRTLPRDPPAHPGRIVPRSND